MSGKGIPSALFMMVSRTFIKNRGLMGVSPAEILTDVNTQLCQDAEQFDISGVSNIILSAQPTDSTKYKFEKWVDSRGNFYNGNPLSIANIVEDESFTAVFVAVEQQIGISVEAQPSSGGRVTKIANDDGTFRLRAQVNDGFTYKGWYKDGVKLTDSDNYIVTDVHDGDLYEASFEPIPGYGQRTDITDQAYYDGR